MGETMARVCGFILGIFLCSMSLAYIILYLNLLSMGYSFLEYGKFIIRRIECNSFLLGIFCIYLSVKRWEKNELFLRFVNKFK